MPKNGIKSIAESLACKKNMSLDEAEKYVEAFFELIDEALIPEKIIKIKGFGTFKLVDVRDRESVDVNTGERVVIDGHSKISFVPDNTLKELVNKPFSQFETVVLNDGVDFDKEDFDIPSPKLEEEQIEGPSVSERSESKESDEKKAEKNINPDLKPADSVAVRSGDANGLLDDRHIMTVTDSTSKISSDNPVEIIPEATVVTPHNDLSESQTVSEDKMKEDDGLADTVSEAMDTAEHSMDGDTCAESKIATSDSQSCVEDNSDYHDKNGEKHSFRFMMLFYVAAAIVALVLVFYGGYYLGGQKELSAEKPAGDISKSVTVKRQRVAKVKAVMSPGKTNDVNAVGDRNVSEQRKEMEGKEEKNSVANNDNDNVADLENARRMVETGAYTIEGLDQSIKVRAGQTMSSISKYYLGEGMECYIQVYNKKTRLKEGDIVNIPKLKLKKKAVNKKVS